MTINKGDMKAVFCINITDDNKTEIDETFELQFNGLVGVFRAHPYKATVTIVDNERM